MTANPAALAAYDPSWPQQADEWLSRINRRLRGLPGIEQARFDHIGSTSVPGLAAKPFLDLQIRILPLPDDQELVTRLTSAGFRRVAGSRADSPGVYRDIPRGTAAVDGAVWQKSLLVNEAARVILHVRRSDSPWAAYTVWFRDWLRSHPDERGRYEILKRELSERERGKDDYDDYTRAKTVYFDKVQDTFERWALECSREGVARP